MDKQIYVPINGEKVYVTEEVYRAYYQPVWREAKQKEVREDMECSLDALEEKGGEVASSATPTDETAFYNLSVDKLYATLAKMSDYEQILIEGFYIQEKSEREMATELGIPRNTFVYQKNKAFAKLQKMMKKV